MKITFLGTGTSTGIPEVGCNCDVCRSDDPRDKRFRASVLIETYGKKILIDCGPDFRLQCLANGIREIDAVLLTHEHYDHVGGLDDLRPFCDENGMNVYAEEYVADAVRTRIPYVFRKHKYPGIPHLNLIHISAAPFLIEGREIIPIRIMHACLPIFGYRIGPVAYLTDLKTLPEEEYSKLKGVEILIIDALRREKHLSHISLPEALKIIEKIAPQQAYLTHMSHRMGKHALIEQELPLNVHFAYDGLVVETRYK